MLKLGMPTFSRRKLILIGFLFVLLIGIPITVFLVQQQQTTKSGATQATKVSITPAQKTVAVGDKFDLNVSVDPGQNQVNFVKFSITYDPNFLKSGSASFSANINSPLTVLQGPTVDNGTVSVILSVGNNFQNFLQGQTSIGTLSFEALAPTNPTTTVAFDDSQIQIRALGDAPEQNVFLSSAGSVITIKGSVANQSPVCSTLTLDKANSGTAPYTLKFNASGTDSDGTISQIGFDFGDGQTASPSGADQAGYGTASASANATHTYSSAGTFNASAIVTDDKGGTSSTTTCAQVITITAATTPTPTPTPSPTPPAQTNNAAPVCQSLTMDKANTGTAPYLVTFTSTGSDTDGTISKVTYNFGDGSVQDLADGAGSASISSQISHTYNNPGTFNATTTITDNGGGVSNSASCSQTLTISSALAQGPSEPAVPTTLPDTGPDKTIFGVGAIGAALSVLGILLFLAL